MFYNFSKYKDFLKVNLNLRKRVLDLYEGIAMAKRLQAMPTNELIHMGTIGFKIAESRRDNTPAALQTKIAVLEKNHEPVSALELSFLAYHFLKKGCLDIAEDYLKKANLMNNDSKSHAAVMCIKGYMSQASKDAESAKAHFYRAFVLGGDPLASAELALSGIRSAEHTMRTRHTFASTHDLGTMSSHAIFAAQHGDIDAINAVIYINQGDLHKRSSNWKTGGDTKRDVTLPPDQLLASLIQRKAIEDGIEDPKLVDSLIKRFSRREESLAYDAAMLAHIPVLRKATESEKSSFAAFALLEPNQLQQLLMRDLQLGYRYSDLRERIAYFLSSRPSSQSNVLKQFEENVKKIEKAFADRKQSIDDLKYSNVSGNETSLPHPMGHLITEYEFTPGELAAIKETKSTLEQRHNAITQAGTFTHPITNLVMDFIETENVAKQDLKAKYDKAFVNMSITSVSLLFELRKLQEFSKITGGFFSNLFGDSEKYHAKKLHKDIMDCNTKLEKRAKHIISNADGLDEVNHDIHELNTEIVHLKKSMQDAKGRVKSLEFKKCYDAFTELVNELDQHINTISTTFVLLRKMYPESMKKSHRNLSNLSYNAF